MKPCDWFIIWIAWLTLLLIQFVTLYQVVHIDDKHDARIPRIQFRA